MSLENEEKVSRNTLLAVAVTIALAFGTAWVQINSRISMLEVQVHSDHSMYIDSNHRADENMKELKSKIDDIQVKVTELSVKQEKDEETHDTKKVNK
jgi:hypothetical protein